MPYQLLGKEVSFKPVFGNDRHIRIVEGLGELDRKRKSLAQKNEESRGIKKLEKEVELLENECARLIEEANAQ